MHEVTHAIETPAMKNLILDYASKNQDFNQALESLKQTYGTNDVSSEVIADISGQLFGNQEFINNLSTSKPNIFKRIYNAIISIANKITGNSRESLFIKDLKNKWENAYRSENNNLLGIKYKQNLIDNNQKIDYNNINSDIMPYIIADENKAKYTQYSIAPSFFELDIQTMKKAISIGSKYALEEQKKGYNSGSFNDNNYIYFFDILDTNNNSFGITKVYEITSNLRRDVDERFEKQNNGLFTRNEVYDEGLSSSNFSTIENGKTNNDIPQLPKGEQRQFGINEGRQVAENSFKNIRRELNNDSSFSLKENINNTISKEEILTEYRKIRKIGTLEQLQSLYNNIENCDEINNTDANNMKQVLSNTAYRLHNSKLISKFQKNNQINNSVDLKNVDKNKIMDIIIHAIADHSNGDEINSPVGAALLLADKIDISKNRVLELGKKDYFHSNLLNIEETILTVEDENIIVNYIVNDKFNKEILIEEWKKGVTVPIKASNYLGYNCIFQLNGDIVDFDFAKHYEVIDKNLSLLKCQKSIHSD